MSNSDGVNAISRSW